jgi:hypothetical protein
MNHRGLKRKREPRGGSMAAFERLGPVLLVLKRKGP